jgi:glycosyltransferase involved in cell wall biosynthesis
LKRHREALSLLKPEVVHAHQTRNALLPLLAAYLEGVPKRIYHNHGLPYLGYDGLLCVGLRGLERLNIRLSTHVLFVSHSIREEACKSGLVSPEKAKVLGSGSIAGIDLDYYALKHFNSEGARRAKNKFGVSNSKFVLGYVGRPVRRKGFDFLLKTWKESRFHERGFMLLAAGVGITPEAVASTAVPALQGVRALGYIEDMREFYAACDSIVLPSMHEGFGYALLEGAAAGIPGIGSDIPGIRCVIEHGKNGLLVPFGDQRKLSEAISQLAANRELRNRMGMAARQRVEEKYDRRLVLDNLYGYYQRDLGIGT